MVVAKSKIVENLRTVRDTIAKACAVRGRPVDEVTILPITKSVGIDEIKSLIELGLTDLGESRVQQLTARAEELDAWMQRKRPERRVPITWHMVGHLQRNKVNAALRVAGVIHSVDSLRLAEDIDARAERMDRVVDVMLQVNCSEESQKSGCAVGAATHLGEMVATMGRLRLVGLMTMAPLCDDPEGARGSFVRLRELFEEMQAEKIGGDGFRHLSMGMSGDYRVAVEEGATILRIGSAIFAA